MLICVTLQRKVNRVYAFHTRVCNYNKVGIKYFYMYKIHVHVGLTDDTENVYIKLKYILTT